jgi:prepilin-type N-terminal cleavage/methylation domain-containing protein
MSYIRHYRRGFTLIEVLVVIAISTIVMTALTDMLILFYRSNASVLMQTQAVHSTRRALDDMTMLLRSALYGGDGSSALITAATSSLSLYEDTNNDGITEISTFSLSNGILTRSTTRNGDPYTTKILAEYVTNGDAAPVFTYLDKQGSVLTAPVDVSKVAAVAIQMQIDIDPNRDPGPFTLTVVAALRNAKSRL